MHDTVWFEIHETPAVAIASSEFQEAAAAQATALGLPEARCLFVPHPIQDATREEMQQKADRLVKTILSLLRGDRDNLTGDSHNSHATPSS